MEEKELLPIETERKFIIRIPRTSDMRRCQGYSCSAIEQIYLPGAAGVTHRIRRRLTAGKSVYTETKKTRISPMSCIEEEKEIPKEEYSRLKATRDRNRRIVKKNRHTFVYGGQVFEIDIYPFRKNSCVMETELKSESEHPKLPPFIRVVKEVTGDHRYSNASLARCIPNDWHEEKSSVPRRPRKNGYRPYAKRPNYQGAEKTSDSEK